MQACVGNLSILFPACWLLPNVNVSCLRVFALATYRCGQGAVCNCFRSGTSGKLTALLFIYSCRKYSKYFCWIRFHAKRFGVCRVVLDHKWRIIEWYFYLSISDGLNVNLKFIDILGGKRKDAEMNDLISIGICGLHIIYQAFQHGEETSKRPQSDISRNFLVRCSRFSMSPPQEQLTLKMWLVLVQMITHCNSVYITE